MKNLLALISTALIVGAATPTLADTRYAVCGDAKEIGSCHEVTKGVAILTSLKDPKAVVVKFTEVEADGKKATLRNR